jgi:hypothetical protein
MIKKKLSATIFAAALCGSSAIVLAGVPTDLPYPSGDLTGEQIIEQVYFQTHFYGMKNYAIVKDGKEITVLVNKVKGKKPSTVTLERFLNNDYSDGVIKARDLAIFRSGKLKGTGMLITDYVDDAKTQSYMIWLPALRKIRRFAQPAHDDSWGGTDFTFGDVSLRKPHNETHELMGKEIFDDCLGAVDVPENQRSRYTKRLPEAYCGAKGKEVYKVKSKTKFQNWWYDERISYVDANSFADYRTEYFKGGEKIKVIDRNLQQIDSIDDPRALRWSYWYGKTLATGHETWAVIPDKATRANGDFKESLWTEQTLRKIKR